MSYRADVDMAGKKGITRN